MSSPDRLDAVEDALLRADPHVATAPEISETLLEETELLDDVADPRREVYGDLRLLERHDVVASTETGSRSRAWWHTDRVRDPPPEDVSELEPDPDHTPEPVPELVDEPDPEPHTPALDADHAVDVDVVDDRDASGEIEEALSGWRPGRSREERLERRAAGVAVLEWLRDDALGRVSREDVVAETYDDLAPDDQSEDTYWRNTAREAFSRASDVGLVDVSNKTYEWIA